VRRLLFAAALAAGAVWVTSFAAVALSARRDTAGSADAIVVLGAAQYNGRPSPVFKARLDHAAALYRRGLAPLVMVTGGVGAGDTLSEAAVGRRYLIEAGLPEGAVAIEATGRTSEQSLRAAARHVRDAGGSRVILVSDGFHMLRLAVLARRFGLEPKRSPAPDSPIRASLRREVGYLLAESFKAPIAFLLTRSR
jgi:uncharacterized SAM-binding protein YcdF (DUF218 family)